MADKDDILYGRNPIIEALKLGKEIDKILISNTIRGAFEKEIRQLCRDHDIPLQYVPNSKLDKFTKKNHQGVIGFASLIQFQAIEDVVPHLYEKGATPLILVLDGVTDVRNFGAIVRSAEVLGAHAVIIGEKNSARINHEAVKTSAGAIFKLPISRVKSLVNTIAFLKQSGFQVYATDLNTPNYISDINFSGPSVVILGSEGEGVSEGLLSISDEKFKIPQLGEIDSLNVSVASGVILYEILKQRQKK